MAITKSQLLRLIDDAAYALKKTEKSFNTDNANDGFNGLPDAFPAVAKRIPVLSKALASVEAYIGDREETQEVKEKYQDIRKLAKACQRDAGYLQDLFSAVTESNEDAPKLKRYRQAVEDLNGKRIETVGKELLEMALDTLAPPLVDAELVKELQDAVEEISKLKPSLKDEPKGAVTLINHGSGSQFHHGGKGNQNQCLGGVMVTGNGATNHIASENMKKPARKQAAKDRQEEEDDSDDE
ncbi:uncharacterized protein B0T15DRAFT_538641 [Chaetomium strumarium]|uniref:NACHT-NTPase and P-loop NTPases N-terminal domain-containing protein n=1 Tax=Chaetomium strumarium TaxID=1170767 RepID=A0AAJ0GMZ6_9PEZI|nr:hypothetical protein B0T15DRAFT_538641 [Chaetomium strumarium]